MIKKLLFGCLFLTAAFLFSCDKSQNTSSENDGKVSIKTVSMVTFGAMAVALLVAYSYRRR
ncbi:hypothetical protein ACM46_10990 [Chryseobacterium angstadtii]|uniref:Lipoprotein n=1 Tax=Chryseobacterium angstadtii TaxID=558151 RepID=A0A0J7IE83_9FLAO|nr:hypothetical protein [Chryseobacterium angstadtii]KMQ64753.1 hypothetical protein ACM46_10990 [Chryseobacterium angstadtii]